MNLVKKLGKDYNLKGSVGWYSNFISRNPEIR
jgi:sugar phosphate isomerase/epimerase